MTQPVIALRGLDCRRGEYRRGEYRRGEYRRGGRSGFRLMVDTLELHAGEVLAVTGRSGTGKSTLLEIMGLALAPTAVEQFTFHAHHRPVSLNALWGGRQFDALAALRSRHIGFLLQQGGLLPYLSVHDNIRLPLQLAGRAEDGREIHALAERLGIAGLLSRKPGSLSVGERQRAALARALIHRPALLLADEPTSALDPFYARQVFDLLLSVAKERGSAVLIVSHDVDWVRTVGLAELTPETLCDDGGVTSRFSLNRVENA